MIFSSLRRKEIIESTKNKEFDILVIGGGITGTGIALDAAARGMKTVIFEMQDFAAGTSSRSSKLIHGGLRYLKQFELKMVAEVGKERAIVYENGPHVTTPERMILPIYEGGSFGKFSTSIGLKLYDFLAGVKGSERNKMLNRQETLQHEPLLRKEGLIGGGNYVEYRTDDARLTLEVVKKAVSVGATAMNYSKVEEFIYRNEKAVGVKIQDQLSGQKYEVYAKVIVNAAGPWVDTLREKDQSLEGKKIQHSKGVHLVIDQKHFPLKQSIYFDVPDGRMLLAIPRNGKTYVGTTDTKYDGDMIHPRSTEQDREYIINAMNHMFPDLKLNESHIESSWIGVRPLIYESGKGMSEISRKDEIWTSKSGLITIAGGKLTGFRHMAEKVVNLVSKRLEINHSSSFAPCRTKYLPISGGEVGGSEGFSSYVNSKIKDGRSLGFSNEQAEKLARRYGSNVDRLFELVNSYGDEAKSLGLPLDVYVSLQYSLEEEMTVKPVDYFVRRTGSVLFDIQWAERYKIPVIEYMAKQLGWSPEKKEQYLDELNKQMEVAKYPLISKNNPTNRKVV